VGYGVSHYSGKLDEMSSAIDRLLVRYKTERIIDMPYTIEDFRKEIKQDALKMMTPEEIAKAFPAEKIFGAFSPEEIRAYLKKLPKKAAPAKKKGKKKKKSVQSEKSA